MTVDPHYSDTLKILGRVLDHDDSVNDRTPDSRLSLAGAETASIWRKQFGEEWRVGAGMWRGPAPRGERLLQTYTLIGREIQLQSFCPIRAREFSLLSNQSMSS